MRTGFLVSLTAALLATSAFAAEKPYPSKGAATLHGLSHRALGDATLEPALILRDLGSTGEDGVLVDLGSGRHWTGRIRGVPSSLDFAATLTSGGRAKGGRTETISTLAMREVQRPDGTFSLTFAPSFDSPTFRVEIFDGSTPVLDERLSDGSVVQSGNDPICEAIGKAESVQLGFCEFVIDDCHFLEDDNRPGWIVGRSAPVTWVLPSGATAVGDRIRLTADEPLSDPRTRLTEMKIQATNLTEMTIFDERVSATFDH